MNSKLLSFKLMEVSLHDLSFCIRLLMDFSFACNHENETMLDEFLAEHYSMPDEQWQRELSGGVDADGQEPEPWKGSSLNLRINGKVTFTVEYHPFETIYFFNDLYIGNTGGHFHLSLLTWSEFLQIIRNREKETLLFFLLLPLVVGSKQERTAIRQETEKRLRELPFQKEHVPVIAHYLVNHCSFEDDGEHLFMENPKAGTICLREHSERNPKKDIQSLIAINVAILTAMEA